VREALSDNVSALINLAHVHMHQVAIARVLRVIIHWVCVV
jgi:hypothetical protein